MNPELQFDFTVDKDTHTVNVKREFAAPLDLVWDAWTIPELLDQWWAPKPYITRTKTMDFREGGHWLYAMIGPDGTTHWCRADYKQIAPREQFSGLDAFCNEDGIVNPDFPRSLWTNTFIAQGSTTLVNIVVQYQNLADLEKVIEMGFKEGFSMALGNLDQYLEARSKLKKSLRMNNQPRVTNYLNFPGNTEEAFHFYRSVFRTDFSGDGIHRFGDLPPDANHPPVAENVKQMILHIELPITGGHVLMGTDAPEEMGFTVTRGNNMHISVEPETRDEAQRIFDELSVGGEITMPIQDMFWGAYFGSLTDRFGINWMVNFTNPTAPK